MQYPDPGTPIEETLSALSDLAHEGKVRYIGSSNMAPWQVVEAEWVSRTNGLVRFISALNGRAYDIACGQIDIGNAATDMTAGIATGAPRADGSIRAEPTFDVHHAATAVLAMAQLPPSANIQFMTITATAMPFIGRG